MKRGDEAMVESLNRDEVRVLLDAFDPTTAAGVRDRAMLRLTYAAGLRVSELIGPTCTDLARPHLDTVRVTGKGRRERASCPCGRRSVRLSGTGSASGLTPARTTSSSRHGARP